jgi:hypothetical protein
MESGGEGDLGKDDVFADLDKAEEVHYFSKPTSDLKRSNNHFFFRLCSL